MVFSLNIRFHTESWPKWDSSPRPRAYCAHGLTTVIVIIYIYIYIYMYVYIYIIDLLIFIVYIYTNLPVNAIVRLPHPQSGDSQGQETFLAPSADK